MHSLKADNAHFKIISTLSLTGAYCTHTPDPGLSMEFPPLGLKYLNAKTVQRFVWSSSDFSENQPGS